MAEENRQLQLGVVLNAEGVAAGVGDIKRDIGSIGPAAQNTVDRVNKSLANLGAGASEAFKKNTEKITDEQGKAAAAAQKFERSVIQATLAQELGGRSSFEYALAIAKLNGTFADSAGFQAQLANYERVKTAQAAANAEFTKAGRVLNEYGQTAKATSAALRQVPAQFTDIIVSLQGGQAPLTVLLQQGGQLKDVFGGVGNAARALGSYVAGLVNPFSLAAAAGVALAYAYKLGSEEADAYNKALILSGNSAGVTAGQLQVMAQRIGTVSGTTGAAAESLTAFAQSGAVSAVNLEKVSGAAARFATVTGTAIGDTVKKFEDLKKAPLEASLKLNESTNFLTESLYNQIKALDEQGRTTEAANLAQKAFAETLDSQSAAIVAKLGTIERAWLGIKGAIKEAGDAILNVGRTDGLDAQIAAQKAVIAKLEKPSGRFARTGAEDLILTRAKQALDILSESARIEARRTTNAAEQLGIVQARAKLDKDSLQYLDNAEKRERAIAAYRVEARNARYTDAQIAKGIADIEEKMKDKKERAKKDPALKLDENIAELSRYTETLQKRLEKEQQLTEVQKAQRVIASANTSDANAQVQAYVLNLAERVDLENAAAASLKEWTDQENAFQKAFNEGQIAIGKGEEKVRAYAQAIDDQIALTNLELSQAGQSATARAIAIADLKIQIDLRKQLEEIENNAGFDEAKREEQRKKARDAAARATLNATAKVNVEASKKLSEQIEKSLTDAIFKGFENGKGFAENFASVLESTFKTMVLKPTIEAVTKPIASAAANAIASVPGLSELLAIATISRQVGGELSQGKTLFGQSGEDISTVFGVGGGLLTRWFGEGGMVKGAGSANVALDSAGSVTGKNQFTASFDFQSAAADAIVDGIKQSYVTAAKQLGITDLAASFGFGSNNSDGGKFGITAVAGGASRFNVTDVKTTDAALSLEASRAVFAALQGSNLPAYLVGIFNGITASTATEAQIQSTLQFASGIKTLRESLLETREPLQILQDSVATGFADLGTNATTFKTDFVAAIDAGIGPDALAKWVMLGDNIKGLDTAIADAAKTADAAAKNTTEAQKAIAKVTQDLQAEGTALQAQWNKTFLTAEQNREREIAGYTELQVAQYDTNKAIALSITAFETQAAAIASVTEGLQADGASLQAQWDKLFLNSEQYRAKAITGLTDLQIAQYDTNRAIEATIAQFEKLKQVAAERTSLETQLLQAQGDTNGLRERELAALDPSNRALQEYIYSIQDASAASAKAKTDQDDYNRSLETASNNLKAAQSAVNSARNAVESIQGEGTNAYLSALEKVESSQQRIADLQLTAQKELANAANDAARQMADLGTQLREFVNGAQLKPSDNFSRLLSSALRGDKAAIQALPGAAGTAIDAAKGNATSGLEFARAQARIVAQVASVATLAELAGKNTVADPATVDPLVKAQQELLVAQTSLAEALRVANAINAPLTASVADLIGKFAAAQVDLAKSIADASAAQSALDAIKQNTKDTAEATAKFKIYIDESLDGTIAVIDFIQGSALPDDLKALALSGPRTVKTTIDFLKGSELPLDLKTLALDVGGTINKTFSFLTGALLADDLKAIALQVSGSVVKTYDYLVRTDQLTPDLKKLALLATETVSKTIDFVAGSKLPDDLYKLAFDQLGEVDKTINFIAGSQLPEDLKALAFKSSEPITKTIGFVVGSTLPDDLKKLALDNLGLFTKTINFVTGSTLPDDLKALAFKTTEPITKTINFVAGSDLSDDLKAIALGGVNDYTANVSAVLASSVSPELKKLVIDGVGEYSATVNAVTAATMPDNLKKVLFTGLGDYTANIGAVYASTLTPEQKALLVNANTIANRAITLGAVFSSNLTQEQSAALKAIDGEKIRRDIQASVTTGTLNTAQYTVLNAGNGDVIERTIKGLVNDSSLTPEQRSLLTAITGGTSGNLTLGGSVTFDPGLTLTNILNAVTESNRLLLEATKLQLKVLTGAEFSNNLLPTSGFNTLFTGTYQLQINMLEELRALKGQMVTLGLQTATVITNTGSSATVLDRVTQGGTRLRTVESAV